jgi:sterol desaturase/sphingolipid hydroxylase (fatty acid hydroxylase superfamily)
LLSSREEGSSAGHMDNSSTVPQPGIPGPNPSALSGGATAVPVSALGGLAARLKMRLGVMASPFLRPETQYPAVTILVLLVFIMWGRDALFADFQRVFLSLGSVFSLASLACALLIALAFLVLQRRARGRRISFRLVRRFLFPRRLVWSPSTRSDIGFFLLNNTVSGVLFGWALISHNAIYGWMQTTLPATFGSHSFTVGPWAGSIILTVAVFLAYEFAYWLDHYLAHKIPFLWEFHRVHHTAETLTPLTALRVHPVSSVVFYNITALTVGLVHGVVSYLIASGEQFALGGSNLIMVAFIFVTFHLQHSHVWIAFTGFWGRILASPAHHQIHHSQNPADFGKNLGAGLALWDWVFGTLRLPNKKREKLIFGVALDNEHPHSFTGGMIRPFGRSLATLTTVLARPSRRLPHETVVPGE